MAERHVTPLMAAMEEIAVAEQDDFAAFCANPSVEGLGAVADDENYILRVGVLFGAGRITAGQARTLMVARGIAGVTILDGLPEHYRPGQIQTGRRRAREDGGG